jgi:hypothetical protein
MFRALLVHPQKALHKQHLVYCLRIRLAVARLQWPLHVSNITCSSSGGPTQTAFGILRACNVSCTAVARLQ